MSKKTVWKFRVRANSTIEMPQGAEILFVKAKKPSIYVWALVDPTAKIEIIDLKIVETGEEFEDCRRLHYLGTVSQNSGYRVHHVFRKLN